MTDPGPVLSVTGLAVEYPARGALRGRARGRTVHAVAGVDLHVDAGEILALVGESGCGKTTIAHAVMRLVPATRGRIELLGRDVTTTQGRALRRLRRDFQMIFQDPFESLNPRRTVGDTVLESLRIHHIGSSAADRRRLMLEALDNAGLRPPGRVAERYPHQLSGGQRQRVAIAAAMVLRPRLVVADEPVSMLDVSLRAGILRLMHELRDELGLAYLFITHDLSLAWVFADRIAVVYLGRIVEEGSAAEVISSPAHPYTRALVSVIPAPTVEAGAERTILTGEAPDPSAVPAGCRFHPRCPKFRELGRPEICTTADPALGAAGTGAPGTPAHRAACHFLDARAGDGPDAGTTHERSDNARIGG